MVKQRYSCDFETTTDPEDCRVWAYAAMNIENLKDKKTGIYLDDFMDWAIKCNGILYFHNLKFDGDFIVNWLLKHNFRFDKEGKIPMSFNATISDMGQWYMMDICWGYHKGRKIHTTIYDSLKKLPFSVAQLAKAFDLPILKGDIDYHKYREVGYEPSDHEWAYINNDVEIVARAIKIQHDQGLDKMTAGANALGGFKAMVSTKTFKEYFPVFGLKLDGDVRQAYRGGFTWLNPKYKEKIVNEGLVYDVNSLYPSQMYDRPLPYGYPLYFQGQYENDELMPLYIQHIRCDFMIKEGHIPTIQIKGNGMFKENEYLESSNDEFVDLYLTNVDLELMFDHYDVYNLEYVDGWKFKSTTRLFQQYIDKWMYIKTTSDGAIKTLAKLMLNSLYGKFATHPDVTGKEPYLKEDGATCYKTGEEETRDPVYTPMGAFITAWARYTTISTAQKCYDRIIYCDTDSIHLEGTEIPEAISDHIHDKKLGYWGYESTFTRAKYIRQKTYVQDLCMKEGKNPEECTIDDYEYTELSVKCAGMNEDIKNKVTFENFERGFSSYGKLLPKRVNGGTVLKDTEFTIK